jgi:hypothetical protein
VGPLASHRVPRAPCYSGEQIVTEGFDFRLQDYHLLWCDFPDTSTSLAFVTPLCFHNPEKQAPRFGLYPLSLAATYGVSVDFLSYRYLDVSVPCVGSKRTIHSSVRNAIWLPSNIGLPHSEIPGLTVVRHLPRAYRSLPRPSSPLDAKTSTMNP